LISVIVKGFQSGHKYPGCTEFNNNNALGMAVHCPFGNTDH